MKNHILTSALFLACVAAVTPSSAGTFSFSNGDVTNQMAVASRVGSPGIFEIEAADDFTLSSTTQINSATFIGLMPAGSNVADIKVEIYRVFPNDSDVTRTPQVPTRANSPSDVAFTSRESAVNELTFGTSVKASSFTAANSVQPGGIHPQPNQTTMGNGQVTGQEVLFSVVFTSPIVLPADHYFFVPQVELTNGGQFLWLSSVRPIVPPGTPFLPDLQAWTRDQNLDPDWLRVGTDIVGGTTPPTFNLAFTLDGVSGVPEPATWAMMLIGFCGLGFAFRHSRREMSFRLNTCRVHGN